MTHFEHQKASKTALENRVRKGYAHENRGGFSGGLAWRIRPPRGSCTPRARPYRAARDGPARGVSTPAEKFLIFFLILFFLDTDPHLASVMCDLYLFSVLRYELCVHGNMCSCVRVSTNLESPPTMGNFKV